MFQSPPAALTHLTAVFGCRPRRRARTAAGRLAPRWRRAPRRAAWASMPNSRSRLAQLGGCDWAPGGVLTSLALEHGLEEGLFGMKWNRIVDEHQRSRASGLCHRHISVPSMHLSQRCGAQCIETRCHTVASDGDRAGG